MSGRRPTLDDIDNYHRLCVEFENIIHQSTISNLFKQCDFDFQKTLCILRGMAEDDDVGYSQPEPEGDGSFDDDDKEAYVYGSMFEPPDLPIDYLTLQYILTSQICDNPEDKDSARPIMPNEMIAIESAKDVKKILPKIDSVCRQWLLTGFCDEEGCQFLHSLYGVVCKDWVLCTDKCCPFVHSTIDEQIVRASEKLGMKICRPDEPRSKFAKAAIEAFEMVKCPSLDEVKQAFPGEKFVGDFADVARCVWPEPNEETEDDKKIARDMMMEDKAAGTWKIVGEERFEDASIKYHALERFWNSKVPYLEMLRAYNNEIEIHGRMRMFHIAEAVKSGSKEHLKLARIHYNRECFLSRDSSDVFLHMANAHYGIFSDTNERVLYLYGVTVTETRDILKQLFDGAKPQQLKFFVFAVKSREEYTHFVTLDDIRKYCKAKGIAVTDHEGLLEFVY